MNDDTRAVAIEALRFMAEYDEAGWGKDAHAAIADLQQPAAPPATGA